MSHSRRSGSTSFLNNTALTSGSTANDDPILTAFPLRSRDELRYADTDRQGHINNAVFSNALETGRAEFLYDPAAPMAEPGAAFVIARLELDFRAEMTWPGEVPIGTTVESVGHSPFKLRQALFRNDRCVALARTVIVQMNERTRSSCSLSAASVARLSALQSAEMKDP
jgi:acyl-CoA thioester hydrolase